MTRQILSTCVAVAVLMIQPAWGKARTVFTGATLVDPVTERLLPGSYIVVEDGRITAVGQGTPPQADSVRDVTGLYALPGLIDTHAHVTLGPLKVGSDADGPVVEVADHPGIVAHNARHLLAFGVTTVRNPGGDAERNRRYDKMRSSGEITGPEAVHAYEIINQAPVPLRGLTVAPSDAASIRQIVHEQVKGGARFIKLYEGLSEADVAEGIAAAHAEGVPAIGHLSNVSWTRAADLGIDALVHMMPISPDLLPEPRRQAYMASHKGGAFDFYQWFEAANLDAPEITAMIDTLSKKGVTVDATLTVFHPLFWGDDPAVLTRDAGLFHPDLRANWDGGFRFDAGWTADDYARAKAVWPKVLELTRRLDAAGVRLTIGTDLGNPYVAPGRSVGREMELHAQAGIPAWAILRMATMTAAGTLGMEARVGRIAPGYEADIVFVGGDPVADIANVSDVRWVVSDGSLLDPQALLAKK